MVPFVLISPISLHNGDAAFTTRVFSTAEESNVDFNGDIAFHMWQLKDAVRDSFVV